MNNVITRICPMCGTIHELEVTPVVYAQYQRYMRGGGYVQDIELDAVGREFVKTGYCANCQELLFGGCD